jgi:transposase
MLRGVQITVEQFEELAMRNQALGAEVKSLKDEIQFLNDKVKYLLKQLFGAKSEKIDPNQLTLLFEAQAQLAAAEESVLETEEAQPARRRAKRRPLAERLPEDLPVETVVIEPAEVQADPAAYRKIGEEVLVELDLVPARFFRRRIVRPKYVKLADRDQPPVMAPAPKRIIENSFASAGLLTAVLLGKYADHLPLYRQEQIFRSRHGVEISRKTMCDWVWSLAHQLAMIYESLRAEIRSSGYLQADETPVPFQNPGNGKCGTGHLWTYRAAERGVLFEWFPSRAADCLAKMLSLFRGQLQSDGYAAYEGFYHKPEHQHLRAQVELAGCWAHARRKFFEAREESQLAVQALADIQRLYRIEADLRELQADAALRLATRQRESLPILAKIQKDLRAAAAQYLPKSLTSKAIFYALDQWERLQVYTRHGHMEIDNNLVENAIRPTAVGKKNWLFFGSEEAGQTSAILYSLLESCRMLGINPQEYLLDVLPRLPTMTNQTAARYTPAQWLAARTAPVR